MPHTHHKDDDTDENSKVPRASIDYFFMSKKNKDANENLLVVIVNDETNEKYVKAIRQNGIGTEGMMDRLMRYVSEELKSCHPVFPSAPTKYLEQTIAAHRTAQCRTGSALSISTPAFSFKCILKIRANSLTSLPALSAARFD